MTPREHFHREHMPYFWSLENICLIFFGILYLLPLLIQDELIISLYNNNTVIIRSNFYFIIQTRMAVNITT